MWEGPGKARLDNAAPLQKQIGEGIATIKCEFLIRVRAIGPGCFAWVPVEACMCCSRGREGHGLRSCEKTKSRMELIVDRLPLLRGQVR